jgi:hypothetical protein
MDAHRMQSLEWALSLVDLQAMELCTLFTGERVLDGLLQGRRTLPEKAGAAGARRQKQMPVLGFLQASREEEEDPAVFYG